VLLLFELHARNHVLRRRALIVEAAKELERFEHRQLVGELRLLKLDAEPLAERLGIVAPAQAEHLDVTTVGRGEAFADLDRRGLAGAVRPEQAETLAGPDLQLDAVDGDDILERLPEIAHAQRGGQRIGHPPSIV
jgi:hypothetical protein